MRCAQILVPVTGLYALTLSIAHPTRGTAVELSSPTEVRPESSIDFAIHAPGASQAAVASVDEGVLNPTRHTDPDPLAFFFAHRPHNSRGADIGGFLMTRVRFLPGVQTGGDGGSGLSAVGSARFAALLTGLGLPIDRRGLHRDAALGTMAASPLQLAPAYCRFVGSNIGLGLRSKTVCRVLDARSRFPIGTGANRGAIGFKTGTSWGRRDA